MALHTAGEAGAGTDGSGAGPVAPPLDPVPFLEAWCERWWAGEFAGGGVRIELVDGPAWRIWIDLDGTSLEGLVEDATDHQDGDGWWHWWAEDNTFHLVTALSHLLAGLAEFQRVASPLD